MIILDESAETSTPSGLMQLRILRPKDDSRRYPGLILYPEIFQTTGPILRAAQIFAGHGFVVAIPEPYHEFLPAGTALTYTPADTQKGNDFKVAKPIEAYDADAKAAFDFLKAHPHCNGAIGATGLCLGGGLAFRAAVVLPELRAAVTFYGTDVHKGSLGTPKPELGGKGDDSLARCGDIKARMLLVWGRADPHVPVEGRNAIHAALTAAGTRFDWHEFEGAAHAFMRDEGSSGRYDPALAMQCYGMAIAFFHQHLAL